MPSEINFLKQVEIEPTPLVAGTINDEFFLAVKLKKPPPILFKNFSNCRWSGYCDPDWTTEQGEVVIHEKYQTTCWTVSDETAQRRLADIYLHEISHRLTPDRGHDAVFATLHFALMIRANELHPRLWSCFTLYDFADHSVSSDDVGMVDAFAFAWEQGQALAASSLDAEAIAAEAARSWEQYRCNVLERPAKEAAAQDARAAMIAQFEHRIDSLQTSRYYWCGAGMWVTIAVAAFIKYVAGY